MQPLGKPLALGVNNVDVAVVGMGEMDSSFSSHSTSKEMGVPEIWVKAINEDHGKILKRLRVTEIIHVKRMARRIAQACRVPTS
jgi:trk system potassium uptake protein TrkA